MNRRSILATAAAVATGLVMTIGVAEAQSPADIDGVNAVSKAFYAAHTPKHPSDCIGAK